MTATVSLNPDELRALDRHHNGTTTPSDLQTLGTILDRVWAGSAWHRLTITPPTPKVGRFRRTTGCDYCQHNDCTCHD